MGRLSMYFLNRYVVVVCTFVTVCFAGRIVASEPAVIPRPVKMEMAEGTFQLSSQTKLFAVGQPTEEARKLLEALRPATGFELELVEAAPDKNVVVMSLDSSLAASLGAEGYRLHVTPQRIELSAAESAGLFYGVQTLLQLLPSEVFASQKKSGVRWSVPSVRITDYPRFAWRGLLIDPARHFIPVEDVKRFIELMALHKFNRLQMHLTDNIGWRVEIERYPDLTRLASGRDRSGGSGGFYTQEQIRELVRFAARHHVTIVPEIEMPYHAGAAINAYPRLGVNPGRVEGLSLDERWGKLGGLMAPRPETVAFMQNVLREVMELFPGQFIHIGGDEANLNLWSEDPELKSLMKELGCDDAHELHSWFIKKMDAFLTKHKRRMIGWDEILQGGLAPGATVMSWRGVQGGITAAKAGHDVVMAPTSHTYFDYRQHPSEKGLGRNVITLQKVYSFQPIPSALTAKEADHVLGGQAQLWGELIPNEPRREYMAYPRACALIETLWSPKTQRDFAQFARRLKRHCDRLDTLQVNYRPLDKALFPEKRCHGHGVKVSGTVFAQQLVQ
ncbi:MAG: beta-N-acetylhexosaminidase [Planctomycetota bacterium]